MIINFKNSLTDLVDLYVAEKRARPITSHDHYLKADGINSWIGNQEEKILGLDQTLFYDRMECLGVGPLAMFLCDLYLTSDPDEVLKELVRFQCVEELHKQMGLYPPNAESLRTFYREYIEALKNSTYFGCWKKDYLPEQYLVQKFLNGKQLYLDTYYNGVGLGGNAGTLYWFNKNNWYDVFKGKKILIVSSFTKSMQQQWVSNNILRNNDKDLSYQDTGISLQFLKPPVSHCNLTPHRDWTEGLEMLKEEVDKINQHFNFDLALISCGVYAHGISNHIFKLGKSVFNVAGALQLYFCIRGRRWDNVNGLYNKFWVSPLPEEVPPNSHLVEGGCYF